MITGEFINTLDEKGRILIPSRIRAEISGSELVVTKGIEKSLWLMHPDEWENLSKAIMESKSVFKAETRLVQRRIIAPAQKVEIDKAGRVMISPTLREFAGLAKNCVILAIEKYMEIWDEDEYNLYFQENDSKFKDALESMGDILPF